MAQEHYEIEVKSLLGTSEAADQLRAKLKEIEPTSALIAQSTQLNHYFEGGEPSRLIERLGDKLSPDAREKLELIVARGSSISVRTRGVGNEARFVVKASIGDDSSENGVMRAELDVVVSGMTLEELDQEVLAAGYRYQAKWSRAREEYSVGPITVCLDKNAGYGYVAEFEKVIEDPSQAEVVRSEVFAFMEKVGVSELAQDRLERMFAHYNAHWPEYYGTDNIFTVE